jgi:hypothetical protein
MKTKSLILIITLNLCLCLEIRSQSDVASPVFGHFRSSTAFYVGWTPGPGSIAGSLDLRNDFATQPINFFTGGSAPAFQRMTILGSGPTPGFVGIGVTAPTEILHIHDGNNSSLHVTNGGTGNAALAGVKFGLLNNTVHMIIGQQSTNSLSRIYITTNGAPSAANAKMTITNNGSVGIGNGFNNPNNLLDVNGGDIDINTAQKSYMIADSSVLWHKGSTSNIFVGVVES